MVSLAALVAGLNGGAAQAQACFVPSANGPAGSEICNLSDSATQQSSLANAVSADGTVVVGEFRDLTGLFLGWRWRNGVLEAFPEPVSSTRSSANGINADGTVAVGGILTNDGFRAFSTVLQPSGAEVVTILSTLPGGGRTFAESVNAAGNIIVGTAATSSGDRAVRWVDGTIENLGVLGNPILFPTSAAKDVNATGNVVVGYSESNTLPQVAFRWVEGVGMESLGALPGGAGSIAYDVSADGTVVVGESGSNDGTRAFRWVAGGAMQSLGTLTGASTSAAYAVNADGSIVVGESDQRAFIWRATPTSGGGTGGSGGTGGGGTMEDLANLTTSFPVLGNDSAVAQAEQQFALDNLMTPGTILGAGQSVMSTSAGLQNTNRNPTTVGARTTSLAALGFGHGISETVTLGATLSLSGTQFKNNAFDMDAGLGLALWGQYSAGGAAGTGWQLSGSLGFARSEGEVARGRLLTDVITARGQADVETRAVQATLGYGLARGDWLVTPELGLARYDTKRSAYTEAGAAFNASYDAMETTRTVATLSVTGGSDLPVLATFDIGSTFTANRTQVFATLGYTHDLGDGATLGADLRMGEAVYGTTPSVGFGVTYRIRF